jgi:hypothetical protein
MKFCSECVGEDGACCDFCTHYDFNGDEKGVYTGNGKCVLRKEDSEPYEVCDDFECRKITKKSVGAAAIGWIDLVIRFLRC